MVLSKNKEGEENIHNAYLAINEGKEEKNIKSWFATKEYYHIWLANDGSLEKLKSMVKESPENSDVQRYLAKGYQVYGEDVKAAVSYKQAADKEENDSKKLQILGEAASAYSKTNKKADLEELITNIKKLAQSVDEGKILLLGILKDIASEQEDKLSYVAYAERLLDLKPDDNDTRFNLAYAHSKEKHNELALYHYLKIPYKNRSAVTWNNLGVARERLNLNGKAIEAYRISEKQGETLAMDNIARMYLSVGFLEKAQQQCEQAKKEEGYNKNIDDTLYKLKNKKEDEGNKQQEILDNIKPVHEFYVSYGKASTKEDIPGLEGIWNGPRCTLNLKIKNGELKAYGDYEESSFLGLALLGRGLSAPEKKTKYVINYEGQVTGYAIKGTMRECSEKEAKITPSLLSDDKYTESILMVISDDKIEITVYLKNAKQEYKRFHLLTKQ